MVPARGGSKGVPGKNLREVAGRTLLERAVAMARAASLVDRVLVSTDDARLAEVARAAGAEVPWLRPAELAGDDVSLIPVLRHALEAERRAGREPELVVSLQPTAPFLTASTVDEAVALQRASGCDAVATVRRIVHNHPYRAYRRDDDGTLHALHADGERHLQRQDLPAFHSFSGGLYVRRPRLLDAWTGNDFALGDDVRGVEVDEEEALNVDTEMDLLVAEHLARLRSLEVQP